MESNAETTPIHNENNSNSASTNTNNESRAYELRSRKIKTKTIQNDINHNNESQNGEEFYECNICWSCLAQWLNAQSRNPTCPVCKAGCGKDKVIPIYGRGKEEIDFRMDPSIPTRPAGQRPPPLRDPNRPVNYFFGNDTFHTGSMSISAGFGFMPFGIAFVKIFQQEQLKHPIKEHLYQN
ncbi:hypothetical protein G6F64_001494 [Rhizopus arrhizus]|uniref:RING-type E3 ubiquitin transferase n=1 Tax=Rhizopus oryzae TaxID=64495 RepID=A0A9P6XI54_RHIOR|nr:hypothetical protein G6F64_001494 [Rhizopus arrhizus]